jgi:hypothetical protein
LEDALETDEVHDGAWEGGWKKRGEIF